MTIASSYVVPEVPPDGAAVLGEVAAFLGRFVAFPPHGLTAVTLWAAHAHLVDAGENTPRLALLSPEPGSGKTRTLEVLELLTPEPLLVLNASTAAIFRTMAAIRPTVLFDEVDAIFTRRGKDESAEDLRALLNAGHRRGARIPRCVGPRHDVVQFAVFGAVALAGLGDLPDTLMSRSVVVRMRKRAPHERVEPFRARRHRPEGETLRDHLAAWTQHVADEVEQAWPTMPEGVTDRPADVWEPLLAIADAAGGEWPERAREACAALVKAAASTGSGSLGVRLLADLRVVFGSAGDLFGAAEALSTETILERLHKIDEAPWGDLRGSPLNARGLARRLKKYGVESTKVKIGGRAVQGYRREHLWDAWQRYLPAPSPAEAEPPEPAEPEPQTRRPGAPRQAPAEVPFTRQVPEPDTRAEPDTPSLTSTVPEVPAVPHLRGTERVNSAEPGCDHCDTTPSKIIGAYRVCQKHAPAGRWDAAP